MQLSSVVMARFFALFETIELNPGGRVFMPEVIEKLVKECRFLKYPQKPEDFVEANGITFETGTFRGQNIDKIMVFPGGLLLDTREGTDASEKTLAQLLEWSASECGLAYRPEMLKRHVYVSSLIVSSEFPLVEINPVLRHIATVISKEMETCLGRPLVYEPKGFMVGYDKMTTTFTPTHFTIDRREGLPFSDNKYYSNAPLRTQVHLQLLEEAEKAAISISR
ncbi:MAG TPA: hypothetical protein VK302_22720 [Terriglobales bacterium]|nr:hypothetical protein [Terriglobales bacterium]